MCTDLMDLKQLSVNVVELQRNKLLENGYKQIDKFDQYFINEEADIIRLKDNGSLTRVPVSQNKGGRFKCNLINSNGKQVNAIVHRILYETFRGPIESELLFIDGDKSNYKLCNLITTQELLDFYRQINHILPTDACEEDTQIQEENTETSETAEITEADKTSETTETLEAAEITEADTNESKVTLNNSEEDTKLKNKSQDNNAKVKKSKKTKTSSKASNEVDNVEDVAVTKDEVK